MKKNQFSEPQIIGALRRLEGGTAPSGQEELSPHKFRTGTVFQVSPRILFWGDLVSRLRDSYTMRSLDEVQVLLSNMLGHVWP
jgi:hypothetical protein